MPWKSVPNSRLAFDIAASGRFADLAGAGSRKALAIAERAGNVRARAVAHFQKHGQAWIMQEMGTLMRSSFQQANAGDKSSIMDSLKERAERNVLDRHARRIMRTFLAERRMLSEARPAMGHGR